MTKGKSRRIVDLGTSILFAATLTGCGSDGDGAPGSHAPSPIEKVPGGGAAAAPLEGDVTVLVLDRSTDLPIDGATLRAGDSVATTDERGLGVLPPGDADPLSIVVEAEGYAPVTWVGAESGALTVPLTPSGYSAPFATVEGSITGWEALRPSAPGKYLAAFVDSSRRPNLYALDTSVEPGAMAQKICEKRDGDAPCTFSVHVPVSRHAVFVTVVEGDDAGTEDDADDHYEMIGFGVTGDLSLAAGETATGIEVSPLDASVLAPAVVDLAPTQSNRVVGVGGVNVDGEVLVFPGLGRDARLLVPTGDSPWASSKLWSVSTLVDEVENTRTSAFTRGIAVPEHAAAEITLPGGALPDPPAFTVEDEATLVVESDAPLLSVRVTSGTELVAEAVVVGGAHRFPLPAAVQAGAAVTVYACDADVDPAAFSIDEAFAGARSVAERTVQAE